MERPEAQKCITCIEAQITPERIVSTPSSVPNSGCFTDQDGSVGEFTPNSIGITSCSKNLEDVSGPTLLLDGANNAYAQTLACGKPEIRLENLTNLLSHSQEKYTDTRIYLKNWDHLRFSFSQLSEDNLIHDPKFPQELKGKCLGTLKRILRNQYNRAHVDMTDSVGPSVQTPIVYTTRQGNRKPMNLQNKKETIKELLNYPVLFRCWFEGVPYWILSHGRFFVERIGLKGIVASQEEFLDVDLYAYTIEAANSSLRPPVDKIWNFNFGNQAPSGIRLGCTYTKQSIAEMEDDEYENVYVTRCPPFRGETDDLTLLQDFNELKKLGRDIVAIMSNDQYRNLSKPLSYGPEDRLPVNREWISSKKK